MKQIMDYLHQKVPRAGRSFPAYYHRALSTSVVGMAVYYLAVCVMLFAAGRRVEWVVLLMAAGMVGCRYSLGRVNVRLSFYAFEALIVFWVGWHTQHVGWDYGAQHLLIPMLTFCFFNIYEPPSVKLATFFGILAYRTVLFAYAQHIPTGYVMSPSMTVAYQTLNTLAVFNTLGICYATFSSSIQESERQLLLNNQELHKEAGTDALTAASGRNSRQSLSALPSRISTSSNASTTPTVTTAATIPFRHWPPCFVIFLRAAIRSAAGAVKSSVSSCPG